MRKIFISIISLSIFIPALVQSDNISADLISNKNTDNLFNAPQEAITVAAENQAIVTEKKIAIKNNGKKVECLINADISAMPRDSQEKFTKVAELIGCEKLSSLKTIEVINDENMPRALAGSYTLKLRSDIFEKTEFESLLIHEFAHIIDLGYIKGVPSSGKSVFLDGSLPIYNSDLSTEFYQISWEKSDIIKNSAAELDFVTGYAMTDPFEDFAESLLYYVKHNKEFRILSKNNEALKEKYTFIQDEIFEGKVFDSGNNFVEVESREWDATKIF